MVQPKHNPQEALERMKLMMKYDSSKTLTENVEIIKEEKQQLNEFAPLVILGWVAGVAAVGGVASWIDSVRGGGDSFTNTENFFKRCGTELKGTSPQLSKAEHQKAADTIYENSVGQSWYQGAGSGNEEAIKNALLSMQTPTDLCALNSQFYNTYNRSLYDSLDSEIDGEDFTKYVWVPIKRILEKAQEELEGLNNTSGSTVTPNPNPNPAPKTSQYTNCPDTFPIAKFCKNGTIRQIQGCLGIKADGAFGPQTEAALVAKGLSGTEITQDSFNKACYKKTKAEFEDDDTEDTTSNQSTQSADDAEEA
jgi:hypothetical protein